MSKFPFNCCESLGELKCKGRLRGHVGSHEMHDYSNMWATTDQEKDVDDPLFGFAIDHRMTD